MENQWNEILKEELGRQKSMSVISFRKTITHMMAMKHFWKDRHRIRLSVGRGTGTFEERKRGRWRIGNVHRCFYNYITWTGIFRQIQRKGCWFSNRKAIQAFSSAIWRYPHGNQSL